MPEDRIMTANVDNNNNANMNMDKNKVKNSNRKTLFFIAILLVSATLTAIMAMLALPKTDNATQMSLWKNNISFKKLNEPVSFAQNNEIFKIQQTASWSLMSGQYFAQVCEQGNDNAQRVKSFTEVHNKDIPANPTIVKLDVPFGCHNMQYNTETHETIYQGKPVRFLVSSYF